MHLVRASSAENLFLRRRLVIAVASALVAGLIGRTAVLGAVLGAAILRTAILRTAVLRIAVLGIAVLGIAVLGVVCIGALVLRICILRHDNCLLK